MDDNLILLIGVVLAIISFIQFMMFAVYECLVKMSKPSSTVHFTQLTGLLCGAAFGLFLICLSDSTVIMTGSTVPADNRTLLSILRIVGFSVYGALYSYFLVICGNPLLNRSRVHSVLQDCGNVVSLANALQIFTLVLSTIYAPVAFVEIVYYILQVTCAGVLLVNLIYAGLFVRRLRVELRHPRGNEEVLAKSGLLVVAACSIGMILVISSVADRGVSGQILSRLALNAAIAAMIRMKFAYNKGLIKKVNGKMVYSRGYQESDEDDMFRSLAFIEKPTLGIGATA